MFRKATVVLVGCGALLVAGCGDDDGTNEAAGTEQESDDTGADEGSDDTSADEQSDDTGADEESDDTEATDDTGEDSADVGDADEQDYIDAMIESFDSEDPSELAFDREQAECIAPKWLDVIGVDRLKEEGISPDDLNAENDMELSELNVSEDDANSMYDAFGDCDVDVRGLFLEQITADGDLTSEQKECLSDAFDDDLVRRIMVISLVEGDEALQDDDSLMGEMFEVMGECDVLDDLSGG
jgi:hypothetical protein